MYSLTIPLSLGSSRTGLTLKAQLLDEGGAAVGGEITDGFTEIGAGLYQFTYDEFDDDFQGVVEFIDDADDSPVALAGVNPPPMVTVDAEALLSEAVAGYPSGSVGAALARLGVGRIEVTNHLTPGGDLYLIRGDNYNTTLGNAIEFTDAESDVPLGNLTGYEAKLHLQGTEIAGTIVNPTGSPKVIRFELTAAQTSALTNTQGRYALELFRTAPDPDERRTIVKGKLIVKNVAE